MYKENIVLINFYAKVHNYLLLNGSFTDNVGINGKSALALFFFHVVNSDDQGFSFLDETISQIDTSSPITFGNGITGFGMVLEHLAQNGLIEEDTNEILEDCEKVIHRAIFSDSIEGISISDGVSGIGLYMISRLKNVDQHKNSLFFKHRLKEAIIRCIFSIEKEVVSYRLGQREYVSEKALWEGFSGVLLFLCASKTAKIPYPKIDTIIMDIIALMSKQPKVAGFVWSDISMWFVILYACKRLGNQEQYQKEMEIFKRKLQQAKARINKLDFCEGPFMALLCKLSYKQHGIIPALHLGSLIHHQVVSTLHKKKMPELFSYQKNLGGINIGLNYGVCNMALSLYSLDTENYNWLSVFGLDI